LPAHIERAYINRKEDWLAVFSGLEALGPTLSALIVADVFWVIQKTMQ